LIFTASSKLNFVLPFNLSDKVEYFIRVAVAISFLPILNLTISACKFRYIFISPLCLLRYIVTYTLIYTIYRNNSSVFLNFLRFVVTILFTSLYINDILNHELRYIVRKRR